MHTILAILGALGTIAYFVIRANNAARAGRQIIETADEVRRYVRRSRRQSQERVTTLSEIEDPRLAATVMMVAMAKCDGDLTERQRAAIIERMEIVLEMDPTDSEAMIAEARWLVQELSDIETVLRRASGPIEACCTEAERRDLIAMLRIVAAIEGPATDVQEKAIAALARTLRIDP